MIKKSPVAYSLSKKVRKCSLPDQTCLQYVVQQDLKMATLTWITGLAHGFSKLLAELPTEAVFTIECREQIFGLEIKFVKFKSVFKTNV